MKAGFDSSVIMPSDWERLLTDFQIDTTPTKHSAASGWHWWAINGSQEPEFDDHVVTAINPFNGEHYGGNEFYKSDEPGMASYVGIEGSPAFAATFFVAFKEAAEYIKDEEFGERNFI